MEVIRTIRRSTYYFHDFGFIIPITDMSNVLLFVCGHEGTNCYVSEDCFFLREQLCYKVLGLEFNSDWENDIIDYALDQNKRLKFVTNALFLLPFIKCLNSKVYRRKVLKHLNEVTGSSNNGDMVLKMILGQPDCEIIDYAWNERILKLIWTKIEIENAFSWLSTLGGAYSALGDYFEHCAEEAGRISLRQYKLSIMLGDEGLAARSRLYSALSLAQKGNLKLSRLIVRRIAAFAQESHDKRLLRMCQGVWAKLKYLRSLKNNTVTNKYKEERSNGKVVAVV